jgi:ADP-ribose pyrophosphatase
MSMWPYGNLGDHTKGEIELEIGDADAWVFTSPYYCLREDSVIFPDGHHGKYLSLHNPGRQRVGGVAMLPVVDGQILLMRTFRHATRRWELEIPRGFIDGEEDPLSAACRELSEEFGVSPASIVELGVMNADTGIFAYDTACFLCALDRVPNLVGEHAKSEPVHLAAGDALDLVRTGELRDGFSVYCLAAAVSRSLLSL